MIALGWKSTLKGVTPAPLSPLWDRIESSPLGYRLAKGAFWSLAGALLSRALGLLSSIAVARLLGRVGLGELAIIQSTVGVFGTFAGFGLGLTVTKYTAEYRSKDPVRAGRTIGLLSLVSVVTGGVMTLALALAAPWLAGHTLAAPQLGAPLRVSSLLLLMGAIGGTQAGALAGFEAFRRIAFINIISGVLAFPLMVGGAWWRGLDGAVVGLLVSQAANCLLNFRGLRAELARSGIPVNYSPSGREWSLLWTFSLPAFAANLLLGSVYWLCNTILVHAPRGYEQMGLFNAANQWFGALLFMPNILGQAALPILAERLGQNDNLRSQKVLALSIKLNALIATPLIVLGTVASPWIMAAYGPGFREAWPTLIIVLVTGGLLAVQTPVGQILAASGRMWLGAIMNFGWALTFLAGTWALLGWGASGLALARLAAYVVHALWTFAFAAYTLKPGRSTALAHMTRATHGFECTLFRRLLRNW